MATRLAGRTRVGTGTHFETGDATLSEQDKPLLDDFAKIIRDNHSDAVATVEGFADPAGSTAFNRRLGQRRAVRKAATTGARGAGDRLRGRGRFRFDVVDSRQGGIEPVPSSGRDRV